MAQTENRIPSTIISSASFRAYEAIYFAIAIAAVTLWWLGLTHASLLPLWAPWEFSWVEFLSVWVTIYWYIRGVIAISAAERPSRLRRISFFTGMLVIYAVLGKLADVVARALERQMLKWNPAYAK